MWAAALVRLGALAVTDACFVLLCMRLATSLLHQTLAAAARAALAFLIVGWRPSLPALTSPVVGGLSAVTALAVSFAMQCRRSVRPRSLPVSLDARAWLAVVALPVLEEAFFRGALLRWAEDATLCVVVSCVWFVANHSMAQVSGAAGVK